MIPFFWFKPGEMDLGGDSGRLYFYDPVSYFFTSTLYTVSPGSVGGPNLGYANIPFIFLLIVLKHIFTSPTILISGFYGVNLSLGFIFCYLIIRELTESKKNSFYAAIVGGLAYVFFPVLIDTWRHVLLAFNQVFLNPLIFYLLLKYFKTARISILFIVIIITFIFSSNFSALAAPSLFAFYPISILFLMLYTKLIIKRKIIVRHIMLALFLFLGIQAFHLILLISSIFSFGNTLNLTIFSDAGKYDRGLSYFSSIAPNIKASINLLGLPQMEPLNFFSNAFIVFPFIIIISFLFNKQKTILLTSFLFLIVLFFATANITSTWLSIYKWLFNVPGFSMFRNFFGQWMYTYMFFYSILFGQAFYVVLYALHYSKIKLKKLLTFLFISVPILILVINAIPLIKGDIVRKAIWQSGSIEGVLRIGPDYEQALSFVRSLPAEGRVLTLPLTDFGYQVIAGRNGGVYLGPSAISYLAGKKDFSGYNELLGYHDVIPNLIKNGEIGTFKRILGLINVKYVFYDADPIVYDQFPSFPYRHDRGLPKDQHQYKKFIDSLNLKRIKNINNKFFVYEIPNDYYLPQVSVAKRSLIFNKPIAEVQTPLSLITKDNRIVISIDKENLSNRVPVSGIKFDEMLTDLRGQSSFWNVIKSTNTSDYGFPYTSWKISSFVYPFIVIREKQVLLGHKEIDQKYIDRSIFFAEKRLAELEKWRDETFLLGNVKSIDLLNKSWQEPNLVSAMLFKKYNFWEISLLRYQRSIYDLIDKIEKVSESDSSFIVNKDRVKKAVSSHMEVVYRIIQNAQYLPENQKIYLLRLAINMFDSIANRLQFKMQSLENVTYNFELDAGNYEMLIDNKSIQNYNQSKIQAIINDKELSFDDFKHEEDWLTAQNISIKEKAQNTLKLLLPEARNLISETKWELVEKGNFATSSATLTIDDVFAEKFGLIRQIANWNKGAYYIVSFDYITYGKGFKFLLFNKKGEQNQSILADYLRSNKWKKYESVVASSNEADSAFIQIIRQQGSYILDKIEPPDQPTKIDIKNLSIIQVPDPKIIFRKVNTTNDQDKKIPQITFTRINPTKYELKVRNAFVPYTLVLVNQFDKNWRLVDLTQETDTIRAFFSRVVAGIAKTVVGVFEKENIRDDNPVLTYFNGDIKEIVSKDIFINEKTFETWGKKEIAKFKHFPVNGFANAWYIEPSDMGNKTDYSLIIEMSSQKLLYVGLFISIASAIFTLLLIVKFFRK
ncbi:MAG: hypothetical protein HYV39_01395 [Candidatus Levybacteria bacterium]|nr:hypothetical protein [Candidatus Levybacteria bacterium]